MSEKCGAEVNSKIFIQASEVNAVSDGEDALSDESGPLSDDDDQGTRDQDEDEDEDDEYDGNDRLLSAGEDQDDGASGGFEITDQENAGDDLFVCPFEVISGMC